MVFDFYIYTIVRIKCGRCEIFLEQLFLACKTRSLLIDEY